MKEKLSERLVKPFRVKREEAVALLEINDVKVVAPYLRESLDHLHFATVKLWNVEFGV